MLSERFTVPHSGLNIPKVGLGTDSLKGREGIKSIKTALRVGYRMIDTALLYGNQEEVGIAIRESGLKREDVFVVSKVAFFPDEEGMEDAWWYKEGNSKGGVAASIDKTLKELGIDYVDLLLGKTDAIRPDTLPDGKTSVRGVILDGLRSRMDTGPDGRRHSRNVRAACWRELEAAHRAGKARFIGVSNYTAELLEEMKGYAEIMPAADQLELTPGFSSPKLRLTAKEMGVHLIGYGTGHYAEIAKPLALQHIARKHQCTMRQAALRWTVDMGVTVVPRSGSEAHQQENSDLGDINFDEEDFAQIDMLNKDYPYYWDHESISLTAATEET